MLHSSTGSLIGAFGGLMFVLLNASTLPAPWPLLCGVVGLAMFIGTLAMIIRGRRRPGNDVRPRPGALRVYLTCVVAMIVAIPAGAALLNRLGEPSLVVLWVIFVVGAHFIPFHRAFRQPLFGYLAAALMLLAVVGCALALGDLARPAAFAVVAGLALLAFSLAGAHQPDRPARASSAARTT